jgi:hypothetical protein
MSKITELPLILELFEILLPLSKTGREEYLAQHPELSACVVKRTLPLLQADSSDLRLPSLHVILPTAAPFRHKRVPPGKKA